jgi:cellobiose phosphorylase
MLLSFTAGEEERLVCGCCGETILRALLCREKALEAFDAALAAQEERRRLFSLRCSDRLLEHYMNGWCLTQVYARLEARTSLYQSGGAVGFRDQLQDAVNLLLVESGSARERILDACRHQYAQGDVMHWWHARPGGDRGVRTRCSDDLLWLCWALGGYTEATGDFSLCDEPTPYLISPPLGENEHDRYETAIFSTETESVLDHALRALKCCVARGFGPHGLPLMGSGDWNDALSDCGGESVWLAFFLCSCAREMQRLLSRCGREDEARRCRALAKRMLASAEGCFNGKWYERAYPAHGDLSRGGRRIDSIVQSWAVFCGAKHAREALEYALCRLVNGEQGLVRLLDPPFGAEEERFGYIAAYGEGFRENGGQYTHAAVWLARACFLAGRPDAGREILSMLLAEGRDAAHYGAEPYVLPADVCAAPGHEGEAGWTWYTGSAGWYFRTVTENMLGLRRRDGKLLADPPSCALFEIFEVTVDGEKVITKGTTQADERMI